MEGAALELRALAMRDEQAAAMVAATGWVDVFVDHMAVAVRGGGGGGAGAAAGVYPIPLTGGVALGLSSSERVRIEDERAAAHPR
jgi:hypothetical protein